jgi:aminopeptidase N
LHFLALFEPFLKEYYDHFKYQSIDTYQFQKFFLDYFKDNSGIADIDWDTWFKTPGMPKVKPVFDESLARVRIICKMNLSGISVMDILFRWPEYQTFLSANHVMI